MSFEIREYIFPLAEHEFEIELPRSAEILGFGENDLRRLCVWAQIDPDADDDTRPMRFRIVRHGERYAGRYTYVGRFQRGFALLHLLQQIPG